MKTIFSWSLLCLWATPLMAVSLPPVPTEPIYYEPSSENTDAVNAMSCVELDRNINQLQPYRYSYKEKFHYDGANKLATGLIVFDTMPLDGLLSLAYLGYSSLVEEKEQRRMLLVEQEIRVLQRAKAYKRCFE